MTNRTIHWKFRRPIKEAEDLIFDVLADDCICDSNALRLCKMGKCEGIYPANIRMHKMDPRYKNLRLKFYQPDDNITYVYLEMREILDDAARSYYPNGAILVDMQKPVGEKFSIIEESDTSNEDVQESLDHIWDNLTELITDIHYDSMYA